MSRFPFQDDLYDWNGLLRLFSTRYFERWWDDIRCPIELTDELIEITSDYLRGEYFYHFGGEISPAVKEIVEVNPNIYDGLPKLWDYTFQRLEKGGYVEPIIAWVNSASKYGDYVRPLFYLEAALRSWAMGEDYYGTADLPLSDEHKLNIAKRLIHRTTVWEGFKVELQQAEVELNKNWSNDPIARWNLRVFRDGGRGKVASYINDYNLIPMFKPILCPLNDSEVQALDRWYQKVAEIFDYDDVISIVQLAREYCNGPSL